MRIIGTGKGTLIGLVAMLVFFLIYLLFPVGEKDIRTEEETKYAQTLLEEQRALNLEIPELEKQEKELVQIKDSKRLKRRCANKWIEDYQNNKEVEVGKCERDLNEYSNAFKFIETAEAAEELDKIIEEVESFKHDFNRDGWRVNSAGISKSHESLCGYKMNTMTGYGCTMKEVLKSNNLPYQPFIEGEKKHGIKKELTFCIAWADSDLGRALKSSNNIGNVGNNDRGDVVHFSSIEKGIDAMYRVLNNKYLGHKQSIGSLSPGGGGNAPFYATSAENWNLNVLNCLNTILDESIDEDWIFRT